MKRASFFSCLLFIIGNRICYAEGSGMAAGGQTIPISAGISASKLPQTPEKAIAEALIDPEYRKCGQDCLYTKANEVLSLQTYYVIRKRDFLQSPQRGSAFEKRALLGAFCPETEELDSCIERYLGFSEFFLLKQRKGLGVHQKAIGDLGNKAQATTVEIRANPHKPLSSEKPMAPYYAKATQLAQLAEKNPNAPLARSQWMQQLSTSLKPQPEDFVLFEERLKDPNGNASEYVEMPLFKDGKPVIDEKAYQKALAAWEKLKTNLEQTANEKSPQDPIEKRIQKSEKEFIQNFKDSTPSSSGSGSPQVPIHPERVLYNQVRGTFIQAINQDSPSNQTSVDPKNGWGKTSLDFPQKTSSDATMLENPEKKKNRITKVAITPPPGGYTGEEEVQQPPTSSGNTPQKSRTVHISAGQIGVSPPPPASPAPNSSDDTMLRLNFD